MLMGHLGKDPEVRYTSSGTAVASCSLATSEKFKDRSGEYQEKTEWHNLVFWGRIAEICGEYLSKGKLIFVEGRLQTRKWQDRDGNDRYSTEIVCDKMQMLGSKGDGQTRGGDTQPGPDIPPPDDDIPF